MKPNFLTQKSKFGMRSSLVKASTICGLEGMYKMHMLPPLNLSLMKCRSISTCLVLSFWIGLLTILITTLLSQKSFNCVSLSLLMKIRQDLLEPNFITYSQTHSSVFDLSAASSWPQHFVSYSSKLQIAPYKDVVTRGIFLVNNIFCTV